MNDIDKIINELDVLVFSQEFVMANEIAKLEKTIDNLDPFLATHLLDLVIEIKRTEKEFFIGTVKHPMSNKPGFGDFQTIDLSEKCFRLADWLNHLCRTFVDVDVKHVNRLLERYVYFKHLL